MVTQPRRRCVCPLNGANTPGSSALPEGRVPHPARTVTARDQDRVLDEIAQATHRLGLPETAPVVSCYEAGRDGLWLHRLVLAHGITNHVVDSSAIAVNRRQRRAKSDGLDVRTLLRMRMR